MAKKCSDSTIGDLRHAYELGALSVEDTEKFEIHVLSCEHCYEEVARFETASTFLRSDMDARREARLAVEGKQRERSLVTSLLRHLWPESPLVFKPAVAFFLLALMIYPAYLGMKSTDSGLREIQTISLIPSRSTATAAFKVSSDQDGLISFVCPGAEAGKEYRLTIESENGDEIMSIEKFTGFDQYETGRIVIPLGRLGEGTYRLVIVDPQGTDPYREQVFIFEVDR